MAMIKKKDNAAAAAANEAASLTIGPTSSGEAPVATPNTAALATTSAPAVQPVSSAKPTAAKGAAAAPAVAPEAAPAQRRGWFASLMLWISRTIYLLVFVAACALAAAAATHAWGLQSKHDDDVQRIAGLETQLADANKRAESATADVADTRVEIAKAEAKIEAAELRQAQLEDEARAFRAALTARERRGA